MTPEIENAFRSVARNCLKDIKDSVFGIPASQHDPIITPILDRHVKSLVGIDAKPFSKKDWLGYFIRKIQQEQH